MRIEDIRAALQGSSLAGLELREGANGTFYLLGCDPHRLLQQWREARAVMPRTGMRPVVISADWMLDELFTSFDDEDDSAGAGDIVPTGVDVWGAFPEYDFEEALPPEEVTRYLEAYFPGSDLPLRAAQELPGTVAWKRLDSWVYRQVLTDPSLARLVEDRVAYHLDGGNGSAPSSVDSFGWVIRPRERSDVVLRTLWG